MISTNLESVPARLRHWRKKVAGTTQEQVWEQVQKHLPSGKKVSRSTISNYETITDPPAWYVGALKLAFRELDVEWVLFGWGEPRVSRAEAFRLKAAIEYQEADEAKWAGLEEAGFPMELPETYLASWRALVGNFEMEVWGSDPVYRHVLVREGAHPHYRASTSAGSFERWLGAFMAAPFAATDHFLEPNELTPSEAMTYTHAILAAIRPLLRSLRRGLRVTPTPEQLEASSPNGGNREE